MTTATATKEQPIIHLPRNLATMTDEQVEQVLGYYATLGIKKLRERQSFNSQYFEMSADQERREGLTHRIRAGRINLMVDADLLTEAVGRISWDDWHNDAAYLMEQYRS